MNSLPPKKRSRKKKRSNRNPILAIVIVAVIAIGLIAWHDGFIGRTSIADINSGDVSNGTKVTVKGEITFILFDAMTITDENGDGIVFVWDGTKPPLHSIVVVRGEVSSIITLNQVTSVEAVWVNL